MSTVRKIQQVVKKLSLQEAETADDLYWMSTTAEQRLKYLVDLREMVFGSDNQNQSPIQKIVIKRLLHEEEG